MNLAFVPRAIAAVQLAAKAHAPTLLVAGGVVSMGAGAVVACKKTLQVEELLSDRVAELERVQEGVSLQLEGYTKEVARSDRIKVYTRAGLTLGRLYLVPGVLFVGGAALVFKGHHMMIQRNATLAIAFTALKEAFDKYRQRVVAEQGSEADQRFAHGYKMAEYTDPETGEKAVVTTRDWDDDTDPYNRVFRQGESSMWKADLGLNKMLIASQQKFAQERLMRKGILWLSDVYESLGFEVNDISRVVGWRVRKLPDGTNDIPVVDFGLDKPHPDDWKYNKEHAVYLDFNCQGLIVGGKIQKVLEASRS